MFDFSFSELLLVILVALIVLGPKQLPVVAKQLGIWVRYARGLIENVKAQFNQEELRRQLAENEARARAAEQQRGAPKDD